MNENEPATPVENAPATPDLDDLRAGNEDLARRLEESGAAVTRLEAALAERDGELASLRESLENTRAESATRAEALSQAVVAYRDLALKSAPGLPPDLVAGDTIESVNESLARARTIVADVRREMEAETARARVPAGAPQRTGPDLAGLSPREKIHYAIASQP
jgi:predicted nuclease with TOPRIM domain